MYGHATGDSWYCDTLPGLTDDEQRRIAEFDRLSAERAARVEQLMEEKRTLSANVVICPNCHLTFGEEAATFTQVEEPQRPGVPARFKVKHTDTNCGHEWIASWRDFFPRGSAPTKPRNPFEPVRWTL